MKWGSNGLLKKQEEDAKQGEWDASMAAATYLIIPARAMQDADAILQGPDPVIRSDRFSLNYSS